MYRIFLISSSLEIVKSDISSATIVGTTCGILVLLFLIQPFGTTRIASVFAPVVIIWLSFNFCFGIYVLCPVPPGLFLPADKDIEPRASRSFGLESIFPVLCRSVSCSQQD